MTTLTANELKIRGVSAVEEALQQSEELMISVRGQSRYVIMDIEKYNRLRELELAAAVAETKADYAAGRYRAGTIAKHLQKVTDNK